MDQAEGLTNEQTEKILQFQDLTGLDDMQVCRDILERHSWDLEVAFQEQMNIREGRPTIYAASRDIRAPAVINDRFLQQIFHANMPGGRSSSGSAPPRNMAGFIGYMINMVFQYCYSTLARIIETFMSIGRSDDQLVTDPLGDVMRFIQTYNERYPQHPVFYQGTYAQALNDAKHELRFLLVYLHKDPTKNPDVDSFCSQTLSDSSVIAYINRNTLFWGCDVSSPEGYRVSHSVNARTYPLMVLISLRNNRMVIVGRFEGDCTPEELIHRMQTVISVNDVWLSQARADRLERNFNQTLRRQQDEAYQQSLQADQEKERKRQEALDKEREAREVEELLRQDSERRKQDIARQKFEMAQQVPTEPPSDASDIVSVVFKLPDGTRIERRFHQEDSLIDVYKYLFCHPSSPDVFEITTNFPKRVLYTNVNVNICDNFNYEGCDRRTLKELHITDKLSNDFCDVTNMGKNKKIQNEIQKQNPFKTQQWGEKKFVPKVPIRPPKTERIRVEAATPWKTFKDDLLEKQRAEDTSNTIDMNSPEAKEMLKKRGQNYRRMLIVEQAKQPTKWESFDNTLDESAPSSSKKVNAFAKTLEKTVDPKNFDSKQLSFEQNNTLRKIITKGLKSKRGSLKGAVKDIKRKKMLKKEKNKQQRR